MRTKRRMRKDKESNDESGRIRYAVVGQGVHLAGRRAPRVRARAARTPKLAALVSDDPTKLRRTREEVRRRASLSHYDGYDGVPPGAATSTPSTSRCLKSMHHDFTVRPAARAGVHVLCEKPMAVTAKDCEAMIEACRTRACA